MKGSSPVAVVTGASRGIGRSTAKALAADGYSLVLAGREPATLDAAAREVAQFGPTKAVVCDISEEGSVRSLFQATKEHFGRLDLLFNNAGVSSPPVPLEELNLETWSAIVATNLTGTFLCTREAFCLMKEQQPRGGRIINNGSISAYVPRPNSIAYTATKHAITGLTRSTSLEGRKHDIACGQIDIGNAETALTGRMADGVEQADGSLRPEPRMDAAEVARAVVYMASLPLEANVQFMTIMATKMPYIGRG